MAYDRMDWHCGGQFQGLAQRGGTHIGMYMAWAFSCGMASDELREDAADELALLAQRRCSPWPSRASTRKAIARELGLQATNQGVEVGRASAGRRSAHRRTSLALALACAARGRWRSRRSVRVASGGFMALLQCRPRRARKGQVGAETVLADHDLEVMVSATHGTNCP